jgi:hypothetical protein
VRLTAAKTVASVTLPMRRTASQSRTSARNDRPSVLRQF